MPVYEYLCPQGHRSERWRPMVQCTEPTACELCGEEAGRIISPTRGFGDFEPYVSPASGKWIRGRAERREDFARTGTRPAEYGEWRDYPKRLAEQQKETEVMIDDAVERTAGELGISR